MDFNGRCVGSFFYPTCIYSKGYSNSIVSWCQAYIIVAGSSTRIIIGLVGVEGWGEDKLTLSLLVLEALGSKILLPRLLLEVAALLVAQLLSGDCCGRRAPTEVLLALGLEVATLLEVSLLLAGEVSTLLLYIETELWTVFRTQSSKC